jgi:hypothetical protein
MIRPLLIGLAKLLDDVAQGVIQGVIVGVGLIAYTYLLREAYWQITRDSWSTQAVMYLAAPIVFVIALMAGIIWIRRNSEAAYAWAGTTAGASIGTVMGPATEGARRLSEVLLRSVLDPRGDAAPKDESDKARPGKEIPTGESREIAREELPKDSFARGILRGLKLILFTVVAVFIGVLFLFLLTPALVLLFVLLRHLMLHTPVGVKYHLFVMAIIVGVLLYWLASSLSKYLPPLTWKSLRSVFIVSTWVVVGVTAFCEFFGTGYIASSGDPNRVTEDSMIRNIAVGTTTVLAFVTLVMYGAAYVIEENKSRATPALPHGYLKTLLYGCLVTCWMALSILADIVFVVVVTDGEPGSAGTTTSIAEIHSSYDRSQLRV